MAPTGPPKELLTIAELSQLSGLSTITLRRYVAKGKIEALQPGGRGCKLLFRPTALELILHVNADQSQQTVEPAKKRLPGRAPAWMSSDSTQPNGT